MIAYIQTLATHFLQNEGKVVYVRHNDKELMSGSKAWQIVDEIKPDKNTKIIDKL